MSAHPERILPTETEPGIVEHHLAKYRFALAVGPAAPVLDAACGVGYATAFLGDEGLTPAIGIDISGEALAVAARDYLGRAAGYARADASRLPFPDDSFGLVVGFETVEHLPDQESYVAEVARVLRPGGTFVCSTPYVARTDPAPENPFHLLELDPGDLERLLAPHFGSIALHTQVAHDSGRARALRRLDVLGIRRRLPISWLRPLGWMSGAAATPHRTADDFSIVPGVDPTGTEILAVCRP